VKKRCQVDFSPQPLRGAKNQPGTVFSFHLQSYKVKDITEWVAQPGHTHGNNKREKWPC
jgi:hypothetical protein